MPLANRVAVLAASLLVAACTVNAGGPMPPADQPRVTPVSAVIIR